MEKVISKDGTAIAYEKIGRGPALILVGGALNDRNAPAAGMPLAKHLANNFTVYSYDRRGRGDSGDTPPYAIHREVEDIAALIEKIGEASYIYGMSSGGALVLHAAASGLALKKLALYEPPFVGGEQGEAYIAQQMKLKKENRRGDAVKLFMKIVGVPSFFIMVMRLTPMWSQLKKLAPTLLYDAVIMGDGNIPSSQLLAKVTIPTLVMTGTDARMVTAGRTLADALPDAHQKVLKGQTHNIQAAALAPELITFFK
jgi:pimeloyl-ACP methyl ester carboxylesterase